jgi:APA family basic amino acid/polyamine antiporter
MALVTTVYLLINVSYLEVLGLEGLERAPLVAAELALRLLGPRGADLVSVAIFLSAAGFVNATIVHVPRSYYAMAEDGALPAAFLRVNPRTQAQEPALLFFVVTMLAPALLLGSFEDLLKYVMFSDALALAILASTLFVLRHRAGGKEDSPGFRMPGYPLLPAFFVLCLLALAGEVLRSETRLALFGLGVMLFGAPLFWVLRRLLRA